MSRTKTNRRTDREQYTRSNGATAKLLTLVKLAETLARDWPNRNERREMVTLIITLLSTIYRRSIKSTETSATCIMYSTDYYQRLTLDIVSYALESCFTNLKQKPLNRNQQLPAPHKHLIDGIRQTYYERTTIQLTIWLTTNDRLEESTDDITRLLANNITD